VAGHQLLRLGRERLGFGFEGGGLGLRQQGSDELQRLGIDAVGGVRRGQDPAVGGTPLGGHREHDGQAGQLANLGQHLHGGIERLLGVQPLGARPHREQVATTTDDGGARGIDDA